MRDGARRADVIEHADFALGVSRLADTPAVKYEKVREERPILSWEQRHQVLLDLDRISLPREAEPVADSRDVGVDDDTFVFMERVVEHDVGGLAADAGEFDE
jgi:hypothetical protein